jgi:7,8-dihydropterin-6-yl-methyl-4-(beta-D-ribofuranosyl)aminobenzene 5'-phosphate synthase
MGGMMIFRLAITVLADNSATMPGFAAEHGLALWIEANDRRIIFDTGQSDALVRNAELLGVNLSTADTLVLSHGHYDHTGGLARILGSNPSLAVYCHPGVFTPRFSRQPDGAMKPIGISQTSADALQRVRQSTHWVTGPTCLSDDIGITGPIPRSTVFEDTGGAFFLDPAGSKPDPVEDDLAVWLRTAKGLCVITGCCHSGLVNTLSYIQNLTGESRVHAVMGGFHLLHASAKRMEKSGMYLESIGIERIVPCHCTGEKAVEYLQVWFGPQVVQGAAAGFRL